MLRKPTKLMLNLKLRCKKYPMKKLKRLNSKKLQNEWESSLQQNKTAQNNLQMKKRKKSPMKRRRTRDKHQMLEMEERLRGTIGSRI